jgi:hypothetical protein
MKTRFPSNNRFPAQPTCALSTLLSQKHYYISDDSWHYFLSWLILQGKEVYEQALQQPATILPMIAQAEPSAHLLPDRESISYVASDIYAEKTGREIFEMYLNKKTTT